MSRARRLGLFGALVVACLPAAASAQPFHGSAQPLENPYVTESGYVSPPAGARFADRSRRAKGLIHRAGPVVAAFAAAGWAWGGSWSWPKDYQHFSTSGG